MTPVSSSRFFVLGAALLFSTGGAVIKATSLGGLEIAGARSLVAAAVLWLLIPSWRVFWRPRQLLVGACYAGTMICFVVANKFTLAANAIFLQSTAPIYVLLLAPRLLGERNSRSDYVLTATLALAMLLFFVGIEPASKTAPDPALGNLFAVAGGVFLAFGLLGLRLLGREAAAGGRDDSGGAILAANLLAAAICLPVALPMPSLEWIDVALVGYLGAIQIALGYVLVTRGVRGLPAVEVSLLLLLEPLLNTLWAWGIHGEQPGCWSLAGCALILAATLARVLIQRPAGDAR